MSYRLFMAVTAVALSLSGSTVLHGTPLPGTYPLGDIADGEGQSADTNLSQWLSVHSDQPSPFEMDETAFKKFVEKQDRITGFLLKLERALKTPGEGAARSVVDEVLRYLTVSKKEGPTKKSKEIVSSHPLAPLLYVNLVKSRALTPEESAFVWRELSNTGARTCYQKQLILDEINSDSISNLTNDGVRDLFARIDQFRAQNFKKSALRRILSNISEARQSALAPQLLIATQPYPGLVRTTPWLKTLAEKAGKFPAESQIALDFDEVQQIASRGNCLKARESFALGLARIKDRKDQAILDATLNASKAIDGCLKQVEPRIRQEFLSVLAGQLNEVFGFRGWAEARLRQAYVFWSSDQFEQSKVIFEDVRRKIEGGESGEPPTAYKALAARAVYSLGKISENEGDADRAAAYYQEYVRSFVDQTNIDEVLMALVLIHADKGEWSKAMGPLEIIIAAQSLLTVDERSASAMSFALFWGGRIHLEQGRKSDAAEMWRRVASEYFSTYYGAMGHYMLEQLTGRKLALQPWRNPSFQMARYVEVLTPEERNQLETVQALLRVGLKVEAACELEEVDLADGKPEKLLIKSLVLHAGGQLLEAVKAYDNIPRSLRNTLPSGFERILFPRRYYDEVKGLALKAEVDPDLVMAIIRQESVFNPMARSPVGALGLMQLMPATAMGEAKRLAASYLPAKDRQDTRIKAANPNNLLEAETNLKLGVHHVRSLLMKYNSPVYVLSAYNASPAAAQRWMNNIPTKDVLSFIERIPYKETRAYVKLVLRNYFYYKRWYGEPADAYKHLDIVANKLIAMVKESSKDGPITNH